MQTILPAPRRERQTIYAVSEPLTDLVQAAVLAGGRGTQAYNDLCTELRRAKHLDIISARQKADVLVGAMRRGEWSEAC